MLADSHMFVARHLRKALAVEQLHTVETVRTHHDEVAGFGGELQAVHPVFRDTRGAEHPGVPSCHNTSECADMFRPRKELTGNCTAALGR